MMDGFIELLDEHLDKLIIKLHRYPCKYQEFRENKISYREYRDHLDKVAQMNDDEKVNFYLNSEFDNATIDIYFYKYQNYDQWSDEDREIWKKFMLYITNPINKEHFKLLTDSIKTDIRPEFREQDKILGYVNSVISDQFETVYQHLKICLLQLDYLTDKIKNGEPPNPQGQTGPTYPVNPNNEYEEPTDFTSEIENMKNKIIEFRRYIMPGGSLKDPNYLVTPYEWWSDESEYTNPFFKQGLVSIECTRDSDLYQYLENSNLLKNYVDDWIANH